MQCGLILFVCIFFEFNVLYRAGRRHLNPAGLAPPFVFLRCPNPAVSLRALQSLRVPTKGAAKVDSACPSWGGCINAESFNSSQAKIVLLQNSYVPTIAPRVTELFKIMKSFSAACALLGLGSPSESELTQQSCQVALNALKWGKQTVNVCGAVSIFFQADPKQEDLRKAINLDIPTTLRSALEARLSGQAASVRDDIKGELDVSTPVPLDSRKRRRVK